MNLRIDYQLLGYRCVKVRKEDVKEVAKILLKEGIGVKICNEKFTVREDVFHKIEPILATRVEFSASKTLGLRGFLKRNMLRVGAVCALFLSVFFFFLFCAFVCDVRIEGGDSSKEKKVIEELSAVGFGVGSRWSKIDKNDIEVKLLESSETVSWININRRGAVAYVKVIPKNVHNGEEVRDGYANVVAGSDGVIEEITVKCGVPMVKKGDSVKRGEILISGVLPPESGGGFCYAEGEVLARVSDSISVSVGKIKSESIEKGRALAKTQLKILNFSVNIFKSYRNPLSECDIIQTEDKLSLFGKALPISIIRTFRVEKGFSETTLTSDEMAALASRDLRESLSLRLSDSTLLKIKTSGGFLGDTYSMSADIVLRENIGITKEFEYSQK